MQLELKKLPSGEVIPWLGSVEEMEFDVAHRMLG
jgi:type II secretory pathway component PulM